MQSKLNTQHPPLPLLLAMVVIWSSFDMFTDAMKDLLAPSQDVKGIIIVIQGII